MTCASDHDLYGIKVGKGTSFKNVAEYKEYRSLLKQDHHEYILTLKMVLITGLIVMAIYVRYTDYIKDHPGLFTIEVLVFMAGSVLAFIFIHWMRRWKKPVSIYLRDMMVVALITAVATLAGEMGGWFACLVHPDPQDSSPYMKGVIREQGQINDNAAWAMTIVFMLYMVFFFVYVATTGAIYSRSGEMVIPGLLVAFAGSVIVAVLSIHSNLLDKLGSRLKLKVPGWCLGIAILCGSLFISLFLYSLLSSFFRVHSFNIYSYLADSGTCGDQLRYTTIIFFIFEAMIASLLTTLPVFLMSWDRTHSLKDKDAIVEFLLIFIKLFLFYLMLQFVGFFDDANKGYCRTTNGCNIESTTMKTKKNKIRTINNKKKKKT